MAHSQGIKVLGTPKEQESRYSVSEMNIEKTWHNDYDDSVLVVVLRCFFCSNNQRSETRKGLRNFQELVLGEKEKTKLLMTPLRSSLTTE